MPVTRDAKGRAEYWCEGCGQTAHFGDGPARWWCGWKDWRPVCLAADEKAAMPGAVTGGRIPPGDAKAMRAGVATRQPPPNRKRVTHIPAGQGSLF